jgi:hypothetical protein
MHMDDLPHNYSSKQLKHALGLGVGHLKRPMARCLSKLVVDKAFVVRLCGMLYWSCGHCMLILGASLQLP